MIEVHSILIIIYGIKFTGIKHQRKKSFKFVFFSFPQLMALLFSFPQLMALLFHSIYENG